MSYKACCSVIFHFLNGKNHACNLFKKFRQIKKPFHLGQSNSLNIDFMKLSKYLHTFFQCSKNPQFMFFELKYLKCSVLTEFLYFLLTE